MFRMAEMTWKILSHQYYFQKRVQESYNDVDAAAKIVASETSASFLLAVITE